MRAAYERFKCLLDEQHVSAYKVAKDTGLTSTLFSEWKKGKSSPKVDKLLILSNYFNVPLEYFIAPAEKSIS
ncbi:helix-turn-helix domain-containing protein [Cuneatibacter caecimuris]|uniref:Helix-turn-helix protein n=1 Tax=Cuneatibacter caecimuris TaxID=1796618 RepID=A0A4Q7PKY5_9FIRM|nr:helix-turn-helix transcriptional regulator [Cuneatibacter caecimuris]RZT01205.1 helix-turn-helix protein [Cuneatibacter caecimuris]